MEFLSTLRRNFRRLLGCHSCKPSALYLHFYPILALLFPRTGLRALQLSHMTSRSLCQAAKPWAYSHDARTLRTPALLDLSFLVGILCQTLQPTHSFLSSLLRYARMLRPGSWHSWACTLQPRTPFFLPLASWCLRRASWFIQRPLNGSMSPKFVPLSQVFYRCRDRWLRLRYLPD